VKRRKKKKKYLEWIWKNFQTNIKQIVNIFQKKLQWSKRKYKGKKSIYWLLFFWFFLIFCSFVLFYFSFWIDVFALSVLFSFTTIYGRFLFHAYHSNIFLFHNLFFGNVWGNLWFFVCVFVGIVLLFLKLNQKTNVLLFY